MDCKITMAVTSVQDAVLVVKGYFGALRKQAQCSMSYLQQQGYSIQKFEKQGGISVEKIIDYCKFYSVLFTVETKFDTYFVNDIDTVVDILRLERKKHNLTLRQLEALSGIPFTTICRIEGGGSKTRLSNVLKIGKIYSWNINFLQNENNSIH